MANVNDDDRETLVFADESEYLGDDEVIEVAVMISDWFGRSVIDTDRELAAKIIDYVVRNR